MKKRHYRKSRMAVPASSLAAGVLILLAAANLCAQGRGGGAPGAPLAAKAAAPVDITGYWVSLVTEDWRYRMSTAPKGDFAGVPLNPAGRDAANKWDPTKEEAGDQCKAYGAGGIMRMPGRLHITWQDDNTLKVETDAGAQTRILNFRPTQAPGGDWQGVSVASWDLPGTPMARGGFGRGPAGNIGGSLKVVTTKMKPGYLRKNGVPYSENAVVTEYFDRFNVPNGDTLLMVITEVDDPMYLTTPFWTSTHFKKQNDASGWNPVPCSPK